MASPTYTSRPYGNEDDYTLIRALLVAMYAIGGPPVGCSVGDLDWWRYTDEDPCAMAGVRLWFAGDDLAGFAWPGGDQVDVIVHPRHHALADELLAWAEQRRRDERADGGGPVTFTAWAFDGDRERVAILERRGYARGDRFYHYRLRGVGGPPPPLVLPPGYTLRHVQGDEDIERRVAVHRDAFAPSRYTAAKQRAVMRAPTYRPELDLVVVAPDGAFAAFAIVWFDAANRLGVFEPVGVHSAHRRRGLGAAIMREGLRRLAALGARSATVMSGSGPAAAAANRLYDAAGFAVLDRHRAWTKVR
jgi:mycothiol synthase